MPTYLESRLLFLSDRIVVTDEGDGGGLPAEQIMMAWETPLMQRMAQVACMRRGDVLEVGFGMGISCTAVQSLSPRSHTIIEAHPQIAARARHWADKQRRQAERRGRETPRIAIVEGLWQDHIDDTSSGSGGPYHQGFDGICFDVFGGLAQRQGFFGHLDALLRPQGTATLWLGDDRELSAELTQILSGQGFVYSLRRVAAIPTPDCCYSRANDFYIPTIVRRSTAGVTAG